MKFLLSVLLVVVIASPVQAANKWSALIAAEIGMAVLFNPTPAPAPQPAPSGVCANCKGKGKIGDGTVMVTCPVCDGTGKSLAATTPGNGGRWSYPGEIAAHLKATHGYTDADLLGMSRGQMEYLHDNAHEGYVSTTGPVQNLADREPLQKVRGVFERKPVRSRLPRFCFGGRCG